MCPRSRGGAVRRLLRISFCPRRKWPRMRSQGGSADPQARKALSRLCALYEIRFDSQATARLLDLLGACDGATEAETLFGVLAEELTASGERKGPVGLEGLEQAIGRLDGRKDGPQVVGWGSAPQGLPGPDALAVALRARLSLLGKRMGALGSRPASWESARECWALADPVSGGSEEVGEPESRTATLWASGRGEEPTRATGLGAVDQSSQPTAGLPSRLTPGQLLRPAEDSSHKTIVGILRVTSSGLAVENEREVLPVAPARQASGALCGVLYPGSLVLASGEVAGPSPGVLTLENLNAPPPLPWGQPPPASSDSHMAILAGVCLEDPAIFRRLRKLLRDLDRLAGSGGACPALLVLVGDFVLPGHFWDMRLYASLFDELERFLTRLTHLRSRTRILALPGEGDPGISGRVWPRATLPIQPSVLELQPSPCRFRLGGTEVLLSSLELGPRLARSSLNATVEAGLRMEKGQLESARRVALTVASQGTVCPLEPGSAPIRWDLARCFEFDPAPHVVVLCEAESFAEEMEGLEVCSPGRFDEGYALQIFGVGGEGEGDDPLGLGPRAKVVRV